MKFSILDIMLSAITWIVIYCSAHFRFWMLKFHHVGLLFWLVLCLTDECIFDTFSVTLHGVEFTWMKILWNYCVSEDFFPPLTNNWIENSCVTCPSPPPPLPPQNIFIFLHHHLTFMVKVFYICLIVLFRLSFKKSIKNLKTLIVLNK